MAAKLPDSFWVEEQDDGAGDPACPKCRGAGYRIINYNQVDVCDCTRIRFAVKREQAIMTRCKLPPKAERCTFETFQSVGNKGIDEAVKCARMMAEEKTDLLMLALVAAETKGRSIPNNDTGKSHLAMAICGRWVKRGRPARYAAVPVLADELRRGYSDGSYNRVKNDVINVPLLVIDDLGAGRNTPDGKTQYTPWLLEELEAIFQYREDNLLRTVVTSNLSLNEIGEQISYRIMSRIERAHPGRIIEINSAPYAKIRKDK